MAAPPETERRLIGGKYIVDPVRPLAGAGGGLPAFGVSDRQGGLPGLMAVQVVRAMPPRPQALQALAGVTDGILGPLAHGPGPAGGAAGAEAYYVICPAPPGPAIGAAPRSWGEAELLECLLRPAAQALAGLAARGVTHRAIRPDNVFQSAPGQPAILGQGWAAPPAALQPALFEPPYSAVCLPCGRGEGAIADDVYALGMLLVVLTLGRLPLDGLEPGEIVRRKLEHGSFAAAVGEMRLPSAVADLARGMLAEDPEHRPAPSLLLDPASARARRLAARPPKRAQAPARIGPWTAWDSRALAHAIATHPEPGLAALRGGSVDMWLRRGVGDAVLAARLEEVVHGRPGAEPEPRADALLVMRAVAVLDPLAPLCWRGIAVWPDGLGPALAAGEADQAGLIVEIVASEAAAQWAQARPGRIDVALVRAEARQRKALLGARGPLSGARRLAYALNPLLTCGSKLLAGRIVARLVDLAPALEAQAAQPERGAANPVDADIAAFVAARSERQGEAETAMAAIGQAPAAALARIDLLAGLQARSRSPAPALAQWLVAEPDRLLAGWHARARRSQLAERLAALAVIGQLVPIQSLLRDPVARAADLREAREAAAELARIDAELARIEAGAGSRALAAQSLGQEAAAGLALGALVLAVALALLG